VCLSPQVDVVAGLAMSVVAVDSIRHCHSGRLMGLALLPAIFAVHTFTSALVWWGLLGEVSIQVLDAATAFYIVVAFVLLPIYMPASILMIEPRGWRRPALILLGLAGAYASVDFLIGIVSGRASAVACNYYVDYNVVSTSSFSAVLYVAATCGALLLSGKRLLFVWGVANVAAVGVLSIWASHGLPSLWCMWAACTSVVIAVFVRRVDAAQRAGEPWPWAEEHRDEHGRQEDVSVPSS
jgi:hypothetical protein